jgi:hypothetical protein
MATDWAPAVAAGIGAAAAIGGEAVSGVFQGRNQARAEARQRVERGAAVLTEVQVLLTDANPEPFGIGARRETHVDTLAERGNRWQPIRITLLTLANAHPAGLIRELALQVETAVSNSLVSTTWFVHNVMDDCTYIHETHWRFSAHCEAIDVPGVWLRRIMSRRRTTTFLPRWHDRRVRVVTYFDTRPGDGPESYRVLPSERGSSTRQP